MQQTYCPYCDDPEEADYHTQCIEVPVTNQSSKKVLLDDERGLVYKEPDGRITIMLRMSSVQMREYDRKKKR